MMFQTITDITKGPVSLQMPFDNRDGGLKIGLRSITYTVGWYNITTEETVTTLPSRKQIIVTPGLWTFSQLQEKLSPDLALSIEEVTGKTWLKGERGDSMSLSEGLLDLLGFDRSRNWFMSQRITAADRPVNFSPNKQLYIHCDQINSHGNALDGNPSTLLAVVGVGGWSFGEIKSLSIPSPELKKLQGGVISELNLSIKDVHGNKIDNHDLPVSVVLEIIT